MLAFVTNPGSDSVSIIDTATNSVVKKISVGVDSTVGVAITADGKTAYVSDRGARNVGVIDIVTGVLVITIEIGKNDPFLVPNANPIAITPGGNMPT
jgi:YVTN family beta-propeller protein